MKEYIALWGDPEKLFTGNIKGKITFSELEKTSSENINEVVVKFSLENLLPNHEYAIHIHEGRYIDKEDLSKNLKVLKGHFNPFNKKHGSIFTDDRHAGDLLNNFVTNYEGKLYFMYVDNSISLNEKEPNFIGDKSIVIHEGSDDLGLMGRCGIPYSKMSKNQLTMFNLNRKTLKEIIEGSITKGNSGNMLASSNIYPKNK